MGRLVEGHFTTGRVAVYRSVKRSRKERNEGMKGKVRTETQTWTVFFRSHEIRNGTEKKDLQIRLIVELECRIFWPKDPLFLWTVSIV